jgi:hypothetical protein
MLFERDIIMRTALEMDSKTAKRLHELADVRQISVEELPVAHVPGLAGEECVANGFCEDRVRAFEEWAADFPANTSPLSNEAASRASIYRDR